MFPSRGTGIKDPPSSSSSPVCTKNFNGAGCERVVRRPRRRGTRALRRVPARGRGLLVEDALSSFIVSQCSCFAGEHSPQHRVFLRRGGGIWGGEEVSFRICIETKSIEGRTGVGRERGREGGEEETANKEIGPVFYSTPWTWRQAHLWLRFKQNRNLQVLAGAKLLLSSTI